MIYGIAIVAIQIACAVHAVKNRQPLTWLFIILIFPMVGSLIYFFAVMLPDLRGGRSLSRTLSSVGKKIDPKRDLKRYIEELSQTDSVANRTKVANECMALGMYEEAAKLFEASLSGVHGNDPDVLFGLSKSLYMTGNHDRAREHIEKLLSQNRGFLPKDASLLHARILEGMGETEAALKEYAEVAPIFIGPEAKCRYALLLKKTGEPEKAREIFEDVLRSARYMPKHSKKLFKEWIEMAQRETG